MLRYYVTTELGFECPKPNSGVASFWHLNIEVLAPTTTNNQHSGMVTFFHFHIQVWVPTTTSNQHSGELFSL